MNTFPEVNIISTSVKKEVSNKFPMKKDDYKPLMKSELNNSTKVNSSPVDDLLIYENMEQKASDFNYINFYENYNMKLNFLIPCFLNYDNIFGYSNNEPNDDSNIKENNPFDGIKLEPQEIFPNYFNNNNGYNKKVKEEIKQKKNLGRKNKYDKEEGLHTKYSKDNGSNKLIIHCMKIVTNYINNIIEKFNIGKLFNPNLTNKLTLNVVDKKAFLENKIKIYYEEHSKAKHCLEENKDNYINNNREIIEKLYKMKDRNIILIFEIPFCLYLRAFLNDEKNINYENENLELNEDFKTLKECFNEGKDYYTLEQKAKYKIYIEQLINGQISPRKKRKYK